MDFIYKEEAISKTDCENLINYFEENINLAKKGSAGVKNLNNLEINIKLNKPSDFNNLGKTLDNALLNYVKNFPLFKKLHPFRLYRSFQLCRFLPGNHYSTIHCENDGNSKYLNRVLAWMVYLNDIKKEEEQNSYIKTLLLLLKQVIYIFGRLGQHTCTKELWH